MVERGWTTPRRVGMISQDGAMGVPSEGDGDGDDRVEYKGGRWNDAINLAGRGVGGEGAAMEEEGVAVEGNRKSRECDGRW